MASELEVGKVKATASTTNGSGMVDTLQIKNGGTSAGDGGKIVFTAGTSTNGAGIGSTGQALDSADLKFYTGGSNERLHIHHSTGLASFSNGIAFQSATTGSGTGVGYTLDSYETGTWTPVIADAVSGGNTGSGTLKGYYTRTGNVVTVNASMSNIDTTGMTGANDLFIRGLPFPTGYASGTNSDLGRAFGSCLLDSVNVDANCYGVVAVTSPLTSYVKFAEMLDANNEDRLLVSELTSGSADIFFTLTYFVN